MEGCIEYRLKEGPYDKTTAYVYIDNGIITLDYPKETKVRIEVFREFLEYMLQQVKEIEAKPMYMEYRTIYKNPYSEYRKKLKDPMYLKEFKIKLDRLVHLITKHSRIINKFIRELKQSVEEVEKIRRELVIEDEKPKPEVKEGN